MRNEVLGAALAAPVVGLLAGGVWAALAVNESDPAYDRDVTIGFAVSAAAVAGSTYAITKSKGAAIGGALGIAALYGLTQFLPKEGPANYSVLRSMLLPMAIGLPVTGIVVGAKV